MGPLSKEGKEITALTYRITSQLKDQPKASNEIFEALTTFAHKLGILIITTEP